MGINNIKTIDAEVIETPAGVSPIWYLNIKYSLLIRKKRFYYVCEKFVCKGTFSEIRDSKEIQRKIMQKHHGGGKTGHRKEAASDTVGFKIENIEIIESLGFGIK